MALCPYFILNQAQLVKNLPVIQETWVQSLGWKDTLEKGTATDSSILAWRIPWTEKTGRLQFMGVAKSQTQLTDFHITSVQPAQADIQ